MSPIVDGSARCLVSFSPCGCMALATPLLTADEVTKAQVAAAAAPGTQPEIRSLEWVLDHQGKCPHYVSAPPEPQP